MLFRFVIIFEKDMFFVYTPFRGCDMQKICLLFFVGLLLSGQEFVNCEVGGSSGVYPSLSSVELAGSRLRFDRVMVNGKIVDVKNKDRWPDGLVFPSDIVDVEGKTYKCEKGRIKEVNKEKGR